MRRVLVVLNERAGTLLDRDPEQVKREAKRALAAAGREIDVVLAHGRGIVRAIARGAAADYDTLVVGGGDGSANCAAGRLAHTEKRLGVLPLGTMNLLARDIGMPSNVDEALYALNQATPQRIDLGTINGRPFHTLSGLGFFSQMARAREETRDLPGRLLRMTAAAIRAFRRTDGFRVSVEIDGRARPFESFAVLVTNNRFSGAQWRRERLDAGLLEVHIAEQEGALARLKAGADLLTGKWRENPGIHSYTATSLRITAARRRTYVSTDGELMREHTPLDYGIMPKALQLLVPPPAAANSGGQ
jgi:diacylglycerol kinase family enzyme